MTTSRGQTELIGMVLLIGLVLVGSATIVVLGAGVLSNAEEGTTLESASLHLQELDTRLETLAAADAESRAEFDAAGTLAEDFRIERDGFINVTVNRNLTCSFQHNFTSIVFEDSRSRTVAYEAGGVWRGGPEGSTGLTPPDVTFEDGTLDVRLVNLTGTFDQATNVARLNVTATQNRTEFLRQSVRQGTCVRPDNLTIRVNSRYRTGWRNYLQSEFGLPSSQITVFPNNGTVMAELDQNRLHPSSNDRTNHVIDMGGAPFMVNTTLYGGNSISGGPVVVNMSKDAGNTYSGFIEPLTENSLDIGREIEAEGLNGTGPPEDYTLVLDVSGSMGSGPGSKLASAKEGAKQFVGTRNASKDRISIVSYYDEANYEYVTESSGAEMFFSSEFGPVNNSIDGAAGTLFGNTRIDLGMQYMNSVFDLKSNETRRKVGILLSDGKNDCPGFTPSCDQQANRNTIEAASHAEAQDITVYTIGYGPSGDLNETLLKAVANETGGSYCHATTQAAVIDCYQQIAAANDDNRGIARTPLTSNVTTSGGQVFDADIPGDTSHIAQVTTGSQTLLNINDPTAPSLFSQSFPHGDYEDASMNVTKYDCKPGAWNVTDLVRTDADGDTLRVLRCTNIGQKNGTFSADIYVDGDRPTTLLETKYAAWQSDVNASLDRFPAVNINGTTGRLEAGSNQALVVFDLPPQSTPSQPSTRNTLALLVQIGLSDQDAAGEIVSVRVAEATLEN